MVNAKPLMAGKRGLVMGVANDRSLAWGIAKTVQAHGAELAFTYQGEALERRVRPLATTALVMPEAVVARRAARYSVCDESSSWEKTRASG